MTLHTPVFVANADAWPHFHISAGIYSREYRKWSFFDKQHEIESMMLVIDSVRHPRRDQFK